MTVMTVLTGGKMPLTYVSFLFLGIGINSRIVWVYNIGTVVVY